MKTEIKRITELEIETPEGFKPFAGIGKVNVPQSILKFILNNGISIEVNFSHIFIVDGLEVRADSLVEGDVLETKDGLEMIDKIELLSKRYEVYTPLHVESSDHSYYANNILNKNCKFLGSSSTLIDSDILERCMPLDPLTTKWNGGLLIYEPPQPGHLYILGVDSAKGTGNDSSVIQVLKIINEKEVYQVAVYRNNLIIPHDFAQVCISVSQYYNNAYMMIENNDVGSSVCDSIWYEYECDKVLNLDKKGLGIRSTRKSKREANMILKEYADKEYLRIVDQRTLFELSRYEEVRPDVFACGREEHDDCVTSLIWALYFLTTPYFDGKNMDVNEIDDKYKIDDSDDEGPVVIFD